MEFDLNKPEKQSYIDVTKQTRLDKQRHFKFQTNKVTLSPKF